MKKLVIIDNDGGVDDAWAIFTILQDPNIDVLALTCVFGNTDLDNVCQNNLRLVAQFNRTEIPVCKGAGMPLVPTANGSPLPDNFQYFHGRNGFGDVELESLPNIPTLCQENAFFKLNTLVTKFKGQVTLVCLGPLTNIALTMKMYPEFAANIEAAYIMGGNYTAVTKPIISTTVHYL
ncbi:Inosine-uridine preferring nucleoside [Nesidiocoris tenuis]|uniref:Inosine-uridine preferring nucleoside n=1 Tax=Nesidiocoris tenuis TaxID=355587 RepID=A0ABN7B1C1_9HEMI|nr:Inosine-uridine preferring nucleoside [Nesidiocoris tenuis]